MNCAENGTFVGALVSSIWPESLMANGDVSDLQGSGRSMFGHELNWITWLRSGFVLLGFKKFVGLTKIVVTWSSLTNFCFSNWVFPKIGPQNGRFIMEIPIKMDDLGVPPFSETPIFVSPTGDWSVLPLGISLHPAGWAPLLMSYPPPGSWRVLQSSRPRLMRLSSGRLKRWFILKKE